MPKRKHTKQRQIDDLTYLISLNTRSVPSRYFKESQRIHEETIKAVKTLKVRKMTPEERKKYGLD